MENLRKLFVITNSSSVTEPVFSQLATSEDEARQFMVAIAEDLLDQIAVQRHAPSMVMIENEGVIELVYEHSGRIYTTIRRHPVGLSE